MRSARQLDVAKERANLGMGHLPGRQQGSSAS
jgi:hypothetical protein